MQPVRELRWRTGVTQAELARAAGTSQPAVAAYESDAKSPTLRTLGRLADAVGLEAVVTFVPPLTREDRRSLELHRAIADRLVREPGAVVLRAQRNLARMRAATPGARPLLDDWARLLEGPIGTLVDVLVDRGVHARELRHVTPFAGVLSPRERWAIQRRSGAA